MRLCLDADVDALARIRDRIIDEHGHVDMLVANAGSSDSRPTPIEDITEESWRLTSTGT